MLQATRSPYQRCCAALSTITTEEILRQKLEYIHYNPVKLGLVDIPEDWRYCSARNYLGSDALLEIDLIEF